VLRPADLSPVADPSRPVVLTGGPDVRTERLHGARRVPMRFLTGTPVLDLGWAGKMMQARIGPIGSVAYWLEGSVPKTVPTTIQRGTS
jgi:hypothetical protein